MRLTDILTKERVLVDPEGELSPNKAAVLACLGRLLGEGTEYSPAEVEHHLVERERLQSTGIGDGVAIPHTSLESLQTQRAALILVRPGVEFDAIDQKPAHIIFGVVGPKRAASEHLKILAKVSRLLKSPETRRRLLEATGRDQAYSLIEEHESSSMR
jgi:PTS system nitrogen regulatory IIA component